MTTFKEKYENYVKNIQDENIVKRLEQMTDEQIEANFTSSLEFGTAGMRGTMEMGTNNLNELTVCKLAQSVSDYLNKHYKDPSCVVCFDTRNNSYLFSRCFAKVLDINNIKTYLFKDFAPTPLSIFAIKEFNTSMGVMITASHNRKTYNGIKVCDNSGVQINNKTQQEISKIFNSINEVEVYNNIYNKKLSKNVVYIKKSLQTKFIQDKKDKTKKSLNIVYTPLNGTGYYCVSNILKNNGFKFHTPKTQKNPDGNFTTCPYPNPEFVEAFNQSLITAKEYNSDIIVATDPDADRLGMMVKHDGEYVKLSGNEVGYIFADYLLSKNQNKNKFVVTSVVTSPLIEDICNYHKAKLYKTLTGFMSLGTKTKSLVEKYGTDAFGLEYEESCGYVVNTKYYDKDGVYATLLMCEIAQELKNQGKTLIDYLDEIYQKTTYLYALSDSVMFEGANSKQKMVEKIESLREKPIKKIGDYKITKVVDYQNDKTGLEKQNFLEYYSNSELKFILRPSGTEPKLKIYMFLKGQDKQQTIQKSNELLDLIKAKLK